MPKINYVFFLPIFLSNMYVVYVILRHTAKTPSIKSLWFASILTLQQVDCLRPAGIPMLHRIVKQDEEDEEEGRIIKEIVDQLDPLMYGCTVPCTGISSTQRKFSPLLPPSHSPKLPLPPPTAGGDPRSNQSYRA